MSTSSDQDDPSRGQGRSERRSLRFIRPPPGSMTAAGSRSSSAIRQRDHRGAAPAGPEGGTGLRRHVLGPVGPSPPGVSASACSRPAETRRSAADPGHRALHPQLQAPGSSIRASATSRSARSGLARRPHTHLLPEATREPRGSPARQLGQADESRALADVGLERAMHLVGDVAEVLGEAQERPDHVERAHGLGLVAPPPR